MGLGGHAKKDCRGCSVIDTCQQRGPDKGCIVYPNTRKDQQYSEKIKKK
jgi:hypothetical protein